MEEAPKAVQQLQGESREIRLDKEREGSAGHRTKTAISHFSPFFPIISSFSFLGGTSPALDFQPGKRKISEMARWDLSTLATLVFKVLFLAFLSPGMEALP